jgi:hypothetical protein
MLPAYLAGSILIRWMVRYPRQQAGRRPRHKFGTLASQPTARQERVPLSI